MITAMLISGTIGWFVVRSGQPIVDLLFWRCAFGAATLVIVCAIRGVGEGLSSRRLAWAALGGAAIVLNWLLIFAAFSRASISIAIVVYNTQPFMLVGLGAVFFSERLTATKLTWLGIAFVGVLLLVLAKPTPGVAGTAYFAGIMLALGAAFFYAIASVVTKKLIGTPPHLIALVQVCVGVVLMAPFANLSALPTDGKTWVDYAVMGVVYTGVVFVLLYGGIQKLSTHAVGSLSFLYPLVAIGVDFLAFDRRLHAMQFLGAAAILVSAAGMSLGWTLQRPKAAG